MTTALTTPQRIALTYLNSNGSSSPAELGNAMGPTTAKRYKPQVQGRRGATMGNRLVDMGFASINWRSGWGQRYNITLAGRDFLKEAEAA